MKKQIKKEELTLRDLFEVTEKGFQNIESRMATKEDLFAVETKLWHKIEDGERRLTAKIDSIGDDVEALEVTEIRGIQRRLIILEKDVKSLKGKHG